MSLEERQIAERETLKLLSDAMKKNAGTIDEFCALLKKFQGMRNRDPLPHIVQAMEDYLQKAT